MANQIIKNTNGEWLGHVEDKSDRLEARDCGWNLLGFYDKRSDTSRTPGNALLGNGDRTVAMVLEAATKAGLRID